MLCIYAEGFDQVQYVVEAGYPSRPMFYASRDVNVHRDEIETNQVVQ